MTDSSSRPRGAAAALVNLGERHWLPRHVRGEKGVFAELVGAYRAPVYNYLLRCGVESGSRDDLFQEIFLKVHRAAADYKPSRPLRPWIFTIMAKTVKTHRGRG